MAIHDADVRGTDRNSPMPNSHDLQGLARMSAGTNSVNYATDASAAFNIGAPVYLGFLEIIGAGTATVTVPASHTAGFTYSTSVSLTNVPITSGFLAFMNPPFAYKNASTDFEYVALPYHYYSYNGATSRVESKAVAWVDTTNESKGANQYINFYVMPGPDSFYETTYTFYYYLFRQPSGA